MSNKKVINEDQKVYQKILDRGNVHLILVLEIVKKSGL